MASAEHDFHYQGVPVTCLLHDDGLEAVYVNGVDVTAMFDDDMANELSEQLVKHLREEAEEAQVADQIENMRGERL